LAFVLITSSCFRPSNQVLRTGLIAPLTQGGKLKSLRVQPYSNPEKHDSGGKRNGASANMQ
jgi:hypothetical protein